ncbi:MAG: ATP-dependent sacrificial sulfur transferase LarE [Deltaproteobacteria bacterium]|nr:ATP-dependent sacrificial sulfur transferase LarE [Deltaproteobacteria bacterium]
MLAAEIQTKLDRLREVLRGYGSVLCTYSGGVDSTLLLRVAHDVLGDRCVAMIAISATMARAEAEEARTLCREMGCRLEVVESHELERPGFAENPIDRCYHCKTELLTLARPLAQRLGLAEVLVGTNTDDLGDYRPGLQAAREHGARQPLVEAALGKAEVREASRELGLRTWDKPQLACLSSRFPYGTRITPERLRQVDGFEEDLRALGFRQLRVRFHEHLARLELDPEMMPRALGMREQILELGRRHGFTFVALDLAGYRTGSLNSLVRLQEPRT